MIVDALDYVDCVRGLMRREVTIEITETNLYEDRSKRTLKERTLRGET
jgi:hypothetical protein